MPPKPSRSEKESEDDATEYDEEPPPLLNKSEGQFLFLVIFAYNLSENMTQNKSCSFYGSLFTYESS